MRIEASTPPHFMLSVIDIAFICEELLTLVNGHLESSIQVQGEKLKELRAIQSKLIEDYANATTSQKQWEWATNALKYLVVASALYYGIQIEDGGALNLNGWLLGGAGAVVACDVASYAKASHQLSLVLSSKLSTQKQIEDAIDLVITTLQTTALTSTGSAAWNAGASEIASPIAKALFQSFPILFPTSLEALKSLDKRKADVIRSKHTLLTAREKQANQELTAAQKGVGDAAKFAGDVYGSISQSVQQFSQFGV